MKLRQKSIDDLAAGPDAEQVHETYVPSESERSRGKWAIVHKCVLDDGFPDTTSTIHGIPTFGVHHQISESCWCSPKKQAELAGNGLPWWLHNPSQ